MTDWHDTFAAAFDITSLLTSLFVGSDWPAQDVRLDNRAWAAQAAVNARTWADTVPLHRLPRLSASHRRTLFHERVHYWQLMSLPLQQAEFILDLEQIKAAAIRAGGHVPHISGMTYGDETLSAQELYQAHRSVRANFRTPEFDEIRGFDPRVSGNVIADRGVAMPFVMYPWGSADDPEQLPAYLGVVAFPDTDEVAFIPFSGQNLLECAAYMCEQLRDGNTPQRLTAAFTEADIRYSGAWHFWTRLHGHRYQSAEDLVLGFLAAVDLAMCSDFDPDEMGRGVDEERAIWTSIPYRFGKIVFRLQGQPPLHATGSAGESIADFQQKFCVWCGIPAPEVIVRKALARLTKCLALHMSGRTLAAHQDAVVAVVRRPDWQLAGEPSGFEALWPVIGRDLTNAPAIGQLILWSMLNALRYRLRHPGQFAVPHVYEDVLSALFPLPLLSREGVYYLDEPPARGRAGREDRDLRSDPVELLHDCISLMTVSPLRSGTAECGFIAKSAQCWYQYCGLGCPTLGLDFGQARIRRESGLGDWCHWEQRRLRLRLP